MKGPVRWLWALRVGFCCALLGWVLLLVLESLQDCRVYCKVCASRSLLGSLGTGLGGFKV